MMSVIPYTVDGSKCSDGAFDSGFNFELCSDSLLQSDPINLVDIFGSFLVNILLKTY